MVISLGTFGRMVELADTYALGAYGATHKSSSLFSPTKRKSVENKGVKSVCKVVCVLANIMQTVKKKVAVVQENLRNASLRNYRSFLIYTLPHYFSVIPRLLSTNIQIRYRIGRANKCK